MKAILEYFTQSLQLPQFSFQPSISAFNSCNEPIKLSANKSFFVAKDFSKQASYFFRVESSPEYVAEPELKKTEKKNNSTLDLNYSVGLKRIGKMIVFPVILCWFIVETLFEFIVDTDEEDFKVKIEKVTPVTKENSYESTK